MMFPLPENHVLINLTTGDVKSLRPDLTEDQCKEIISKLRPYHEAIKTPAHALIKFLCDCNFPKEDINSNLTNYCEVLELCPVCEGKLGQWDTNIKESSHGCIYCDKEGIVAYKIPLACIYTTIIEKMSKFDYDYSKKFNSNFEAYNVGNATYQSLLSHIKHIDKQVALILWNMHVKKASTMPI